MIPSLADLEATLDLVRHWRVTTEADQRDIGEIESMAKALYAEACAAGLQPGDPVYDAIERLEGACTTKRLTPLRGWRGE